jgi:hypothetical protein
LSEKGRFTFVRDVGKSEEETGLALSYGYVF